MDADFRIEPYRKIAAVSKELSAKLDKQAVIEVVCRTARELAQSDGACVILREEEFVHYAREDAIARLWAGQRFPITNCISGWSILHRTPVVIEDIYADERVPVEYYRGTFVKSLAMTPIQQDHPVGAIGVYWARRHRATEQQLELLEMLADLAAVAFINVKLFDEMKSARLEAEAQAEELRNRAELIDQSYDALIVWEPGGPITSWSKGAEELYGFSKREAVCQVIHDLLHTTFPDATQEYEKTLRQTGRWEGELLRTRKGGEKVVVFSRCKVVNQNGRSYVLESSRDITERKRAEEALRQSERRFAAAFQASPLALTITSLSTGRLLEVNETFTRLSGYTREEAVGRTTLELGLWCRPSDREAELAMVSRNGKARTLEYRFRMKDGTELIGLLSAEQIEIGGEPCALTVIEDITEKKRAEAERERLLVIEQEARRQAETASRMKDEFLATVSHELRTPLNAILGWSTMLSRGRLDEPTAARALKTIERNARAQAQLIEDLLDVSRIITGKLRLDVKPVDLTSIIKAAIDSVRPAAEAKGIQLQLVVLAADFISGDPTRLQQVMWNLLSNAVKFTNAGGRVEVGLERADSQARITVSDTGEGISPEFLPYVFDRFRQEDGKITRRHGGLGLGLAIVRHIVEMHGGTIEAHSAGNGHGATFTVRLPLVATRFAETSLASDDEQASLSETSTVNIDPSILRGLRLLAVDDEPDTREMVKGVLEQYGAEVVTAASAGEGLDALLEWKPDLLVCDIGMPGEDGYNLIRKVRALEARQGGNTPAVALTGYVRVEERIRALEAGYQMFVPKPVEADELVLIVASLVGRTSRSSGA